MLCIVPDIMCCFLPTTLDLSYQTYCVPVFLSCSSLEGSLYLPLRLPHFWSPSPSPRSQPSTQARITNILGDFPSPWNRAQALCLQRYAHSVFRSLLTFSPHLECQPSFHAYKTCIFYSLYNGLLTSPRHREMHCGYSYKDKKRTFYTHGSYRPIEGDR